MPNDHIHTPTPILAVFLDPCNIPALRDDPPEFVLVCIECGMELNSPVAELVAA